ncbi:MAG: M28 family peptidase [Candidatus Eremiobacteraeota bacterium]|nr:M28 family peptidase [Candidatus Eremiobacteraeota bacterium]
MAKQLSIAAVRTSLAVVLLAAAFCGCSNAGRAIPAGAGLGDAGAREATQSCMDRVNATIAEIETCLTQSDLWQHLAHFQTIANHNKLKDGHGYRDTGTPGYLASVNYVAGLMRQAGYRVTIQQYSFTIHYPDATAAPDATGRRHETLLRAWFDAHPGLKHKTFVDYNVIADSPYGDPGRVVVIEGHLDSIFGAGMLDNASGSTTMLEVARAMAKTRTRNHLRYIWFGGEELGLFGSRHYTTTLSASDLRHVVFDVDVDVTATPNFDILVADPQYASNVKKFPPNVVPQSKVGNDDFAQFFNVGGVVSQPAVFGNDGTDSNSFSLVGVPDTGILTNQDCCKKAWEKHFWGGFAGNYEGDIPSFNGGCVDRPFRWCDNLSNNDPFVLQLASRAVAYVTFALANDGSLRVR